MRFNIDKFEPLRTLDYDLDNSRHTASYLTGESYDGNVLPYLISYEIIEICSRIENLIS